MVAAPIAELLDGPTPPFPRFTTGVSMDTYRAGHLISISRAANKKPDFKLLEGLDEVWAFAIRKPKDFQARLLGRFVQKDIFVGTQLYLRTELGSPTQYNAIAAQTATQWDAATGGVKPLRSAANEDYLSYVVRDLDKDD